jgi:hypothetical protein
MRRPEKIRLKDGRTRWQLRFEDAHRRMRYKRFATRADAEAFAKTLDAARAAGIDPARRVRFHELAEEWRASHLAHGLRPSAVKDYKQSLQRLCASLGQRELRGITAADLERLRNELVSPSGMVETPRLQAKERFV